MGIGQSSQTQIPIDCQVNQWTACSAPCGGGTRTRTVMISASNGGKSCPVLSEACNTQACPAVVSQVSPTLAPPSPSPQVTTQSITQNGIVYQPTIATSQQQSQATPVSVTGNLSLGVNQNQTTVVSTPSAISQAITTPQPIIKTTPNSSVANPAIISYLTMNAPNGQLSTISLSGEASLQWSNGQANQVILLIVPPGVSVTSFQSNNFTGNSHDVYNGSGNWSIPIVFGGNELYSIGFTVQSLIFKLSPIPVHAIPSETSSEVLFGHSPLIERFGGDNNNLYLRVLLIVILFIGIYLMCDCYKQN